MCERISDRYYTAISFNVFVAKMIFNKQYPEKHVRSLIVNILAAETIMIYYMEFISCGRIYIYQPDVCVVIA